MRTKLRKISIFAFELVKLWRALSCGLRPLLYFWPFHFFRYICRMKCNVALSEKARKELELLKANPSPVEDLLARQARNAMASLPPLPPGFRYDIDTEIAKEGSDYVCYFSFTPRQVFLADD